MRYLLSIITLLFFHPVFNLNAQENGNWDALRSQYKEFKLLANSRVVYDLDIPYGTTQLVYRVTVLQVNQDIPNKLSSFAASFKTPETMIAATGFELASALIGTDKCKFYIFQNKDDAINYRNSGTVRNPCYSEPKPVPKSNGYFNEKCINIYSNKLYFGIETTNTQLNSNLVIEILPWVSPEMERGWTNEARNKVYNYLTSIYNEDICQCILDKIILNYKLIDFPKNQSDEDRVLKKYANECLDELGLSKEAYDEVYEEYRYTADSLIEIGDYAGAIEILLIFDDKSVARANDEDYNNLGWCYLLTKQYLKAIKYLKKGEIIDETNLLVKGNLAHAYLLSGDFDKAKDIYTKYKGNNIDDSNSWESVIAEDFKTFKKIGIKSDKFDIILGLLNE